VCVFHEASDDKIQKTVHWVAGDWCLSVVYFVEQELPHYSTSPIIMNDPANRIMTNCKKNIYICRISKTMYVELGVSVNDTSYDTKPQPYVEQVI
jgi:hypothetical protein